MLWWELFLSFAAGSLLGVFFFGGLWWTVRRLPQAHSPALLALASFILRTTAVVAVFYLVLSGFTGPGWPRLAAALAGFILLRMITVSRIRSQDLSNTAAETKAPPDKEGG